MKLEMITEGLTKLLAANNYRTVTIMFYEREWERLRKYLLSEFGDTEYDIERGLKYLEEKHGFITRYNDGTLMQSKVQLLRIVNMLEDYRIHGVLTRRYYASKNPITLSGELETVFSEYAAMLRLSDLSMSTQNHYIRISQIFLDYLSQLGIDEISELSFNHCNEYIKTLAGYSFKTIEQKICGIRHFLRFEYEKGALTEDYASKIHMPHISKNAKIPSSWSIDELKSMISVIDRNSPIGKRDYAMILLACVLGIRAFDIKHLRFENFDWTEKKISFVQHKTGKKLTLPITNEIGWAVIDYIKNGRPRYYDTDVVFVKHMPPFEPMADDNHMHHIITRYMRKAGIDRRGHKHSGFHSLRHSAGLLLLDMETPLPIITSILGHSDSDSTAIYLKADIAKLAECVLDSEVL